MSLNKLVKRKALLNKIVAILMFISLSISMNCAVYKVYAEDFVSSGYETKTYKSKEQFITSKYDTAVLKEKSNTASKLKKGSVVVNVKTMCDKEYQKLYAKDWKIRAQRITKKGTKALYSKFNIYFIPKKAVTFKSANSTNAVTLLNNFSKKYKVSKKIDMIIGFSGKKPAHIAGITYIGKINGGPRILIFASSYETEAETVQHEIGHTYDLIHCEKKCVMTSQGFGYLNKFCSAHLKKWNKNRKYYN